MLTLLGPLLHSSTRLRGCCYFSPCAGRPPRVKAFLPCLICTSLSLCVCLEPKLSSTNDDSSSYPLFYEDQIFPTQHQSAANVSSVKLGNKYLFPHFHARLFSSWVCMLPPLLWVHMSSVSGSWRILFPYVYAPGPSYYNLSTLCLPMVTEPWVDEV